MSTLRYARLLNTGLQQASKSPLLASSPAALQIVPTATITRLSRQDPEHFPKVPPWDYKNKYYYKFFSYNFFSWIDPSYVRMNPNSKIITVEGNMGSKKGEFAEKLAKELGMLYMPEPRVEDLYVNHNGFDYRTLNKYIGEKLHAIDEKMYYENPKHLAVPWFKIFYYRLKYEQYIEALAHLLNTGQGVVMERSVFSDFAFTDAMYKNGWLPKDAYDYYYRLRYDTIHKLLRPHLVIYLDTDVETSMANIKAKNIPYQVNSKVMTSQYVKDIRDAYVETYLPDIGQFSELLVFKWNQVKLDGMEWNDVLDEIEKLEMDEWDITQQKFKDWGFYWNEFWNKYRYTYTTKMYTLMFDFNRTISYDVDSLDLDPNESLHRDKVYQSFVTEYGCLPEYEQKNGFLRSLINKSNHWTAMKFMQRCPVY